MDCWVSERGFVHFFVQIFNIFVDYFLFFFNLNNFFDNIQGCFNPMLWKIWLFFFEISMVFKSSNSEFISKKCQRDQCEFLSFHEKKPTVKARIIHWWFGFNWTKWFQLWKVSFLIWFLIYSGSHFGQIKLHTSSLQNEHYW